MTKTALVTGGSGGIGGATVALLRERGWNVDAPPRNHLAFGYDGGNWWTFRPKLARAGDTLDALVFCHGEWYSKDFQDQSSRDWIGQLDMRVYGPARFMANYLHALKNSIGCVVMVSSTRAFIGGMNSGPYSCAAAAQVALMTGMARECSGVRFYCVCPGLTDTRMAEQVRATGGCKPEAVAQPPEAVAAAILACIEDQHPSGSVLRVVDGQVKLAKWGWE